MLFKFDAGVEIDIATKDELAGEFDKAFKQREAKPTQLSFTKSSAEAGGGNGAMKVGRPPSGRMWNILTVTLSGIDDSTAVTGKAALYVDSLVSNLDLGTLRIPAMAIPGFVSISKGTMWAHSTGDVVVNLSGITGSTVVVATVCVAEYNERDLGPLTTR